jgi:hypothetical protein
MLSMEPSPRGDWARSTTRRQSRSTVIVGIDRVELISWPVEVAAPTDIKRLRATLGDALGDARVVRSFFTVIELVWDEKEALAIDAAAAAADRRTELQDRYDARLAAGAESTELTKLSAELRACEKAIVDMTAKISFDAGPAKSERHVRAARSRWDRRDAAWAAARGGA